MVYYSTIYLLSINVRRFLHKDCFLICISLERSEYASERVQLKIFYRVALADVQGRSPPPASFAESASALFFNRICEPYRNTFFKISIL